MRSWVVILVGLYRTRWSKENIKILSATNHPHRILVKTSVRNFIPSRIGTFTMMDGSIGLSPSSAGGEKVLYPILSVGLHYFWLLLSSRCVSQYLVITLLMYNNY